MWTLTSGGEISNGRRDCFGISASSQVGLDRRARDGTTLRPHLISLSVLLGLVLLVLSLALSRCLRHLRTRETGSAIGQPVDCLDKLTAAEKHLEIDGATAALATTAAVENLLPRIDGKAIVAGTADRTSTDEFATRLAKLSAMCLRDLDHVAGARLIDQRVPFVAA